MKKGISLIVLIITIIVLVILSGIVVINSNVMLVNADKHKLQIDISQLESLMNTYKIRKNGNISFEKVEFNVSSLSAIELGQFEGETIVNNKVTLYVIDLLEIDAEAVNYGNLKQGPNDRYLYSIETGKVYYEKGLKIDNVKYYYVENGEGYL